LTHKLAKALIGDQLLEINDDISKFIRANGKFHNLIYKDDDGSVKTSIDPLWSGHRTLYSSPRWTDRDEFKNRINDVTQSFYTSKSQLSDLIADVQKKFNLALNGSLKTIWE